MAQALNINARFLISMLVSALPGAMTSRPGILSDEEGIGTEATIYVLLSLFEKVRASEVTGVFKPAQNFAENGDER